jgi:hypothetical protein
MKHFKLRGRWGEMDVCAADEQAAVKRYLETAVSVSSPTVQDRGGHYSVQVDGWHVGSVFVEATP